MTVNNVSVSLILPGFCLFAAGLFLCAISLHSHKYTWIVFTLFPVMLTAGEYLITDTVRGINMLWFSSWGKRGLGPGIAGVISDLWGLLSCFMWAWMLSHGWPLSALLATTAGICGILITPTFVFLKLPSGQDTPSTNQEDTDPQPARLTRMYFLRSAKFWKRNVMHR